MGAQVENVPMNAKEALLHQLKVSCTWVLIMLSSQLALSAVVWMREMVVFLVVHTLFVAAGIIGVQSKRNCFLRAHMIYTIMLSALIVVVLLSEKMQFFKLAFLVAFVLLQAVGIKHERILMLMFPLAEELHGVELEAGNAEEQQPLTAQEAPAHAQEEDQELQHMIAMIQAMEQQNQQNVVPQTQSPAGENEQTYAMPQYPNMLPVYFSNQPQQQFVYVPFQVTPGGEYFQQPMMVPPPPMYYSPTASLDNR